MTSSEWFQGLQDVRIGFGKASSTNALAALTGLRNLQTAHLWDTPILEESRKLRFESLNRLRFRATLLTSTGMKTLMSWSLPNLKVFEPEGCRIKSTAIRNLTRAEWARQLRVLSLESNWIDDKGVTILASSGILRSIRILNLNWNAMSAAGLMPLAAEGVMPELTTLELNAPEEKHFRGTQAEMEEFLRTLTLPKLRHLDLSRWPLGDCGAIALAANPSFVNLRSLDLSFCKIGPKGAAAICESPYLSNLLNLHLDFNDIGDGIASLRDCTVLPHLSRIGANTMSHTPQELKTAFEQMRDLLKVARPDVSGLG